MWRITVEGLGRPSKTLLAGTSLSLSAAACRVTSTPCGGGGAG